jgi:hypothetical protein
MQVANANLGKKNIFQDDRYLGAQACFIDYNMDDPNAPTVNSANKICAVYVKNDSGGALGSGKGVVYKSGQVGKKVGGYHSANGRCDGVIDPFLGAGVTVADGDYFWLVIQGPIDVVIGAGDQTVNTPIQTLANGVFGTGTPGTNPLGHSGISNEAGVSGDRIRAFFTNAFSAVKPC